MSNAFCVTEPDWNDIEAADITEQPFLSDDKTLIVPTQYGELSLSISQFGLRIQSDVNTTDDFAMLTQSPDKRTLVYSGDKSHSTLVAGNYRLEIFASPLHFKLYKDDVLVQQSATDGHFVRQHRLPPFAKTDSG